MEEWRARQALAEIVGSNYGQCQCHESTMRTAAEALELHIPKKVKIENWCPAYCPSCGTVMSESLGDGYYKNPTHLDKCPECTQVLEW